ncbi:hypothetical protein J7E50_23500 [Pedobacter sp. ISL-68]|uniref:hypothetical protein n=1 Tax=unclassified Pedobacter TaxID=2628915 RepID=UPI001BE84BC9|nr:MULTISPECIES: hypothetical protein [unclassified Pedobacter]MBT2564386.1 hypothetical protein [Pedobacter sp. ISL-64]MBT2593206.1 hypothetical protein [Pedobacter sp. ISL-68]
MIQKIENRITAFNQVAGPYKQISFHDAATAAEMEQLKTYFEIPVPADLVSFYSQLGSLKPYDDELFALSIDSAQSLIESINHQNKWYRCQSLGIVDYIKFCWINDRQELEEDNYLNKAQLHYLNSNYKCFGLYRTNWGFEEADYLYFDSNGNFGTVRYHQDNISDFLDHYLIPLTHKSLATETFEAIMLRIIDQLQEGLLANRRELGE